MKTLEIEKINTMDELRDKFDWRAFCGQFNKLKEIVKKSDDAFLVDTRINNNLRLCQIIFLRGSDKIGQLFFESAYGRNFQLDLTEQMPKIKLIHSNQIVCFSANNRIKI